MKIFILLFFTLVTSNLQELEVKLEKYEKKETISKKIVKIKKKKINKRYIPKSIKELNELYTKEYDIVSVKPKRKIKVAILDGLFSRKEKLKYVHVIKNNNDLIEAEEQLHGTHVGGIILATNPHIELFAYSIFEKNPTVTSTITNIVKSIDDAISKKVDIINISFNGPVDNEEEKQALARAEKAGIIVVIAAGNDQIGLNKDSCQSYPACHSLKFNNIIVVGNITKEHSLNNSSNFGEVVDVYFNGTDIPSLSVKDGFYKMSGTSMSSPFIAGIVSQIMGQSSKKLSVTELKKTISKNIHLSHNLQSKVLNYKQAIRTIASKK